LIDKSSLQNITSLPNTISIKKDYFSIGKSVIDFVFGLLGSVFLVLIYPIIAIGIKINSPGPVLFKQKRVGQYGKVFWCYKFRTMHTKQLRRNNLSITKKEDARIFALGQFLRKTNLDEMPQVINVLKGEMSIIGPRPYWDEEDTYWCARIPGFRVRNLVKPGLTGWSQVNGFRGGTLDLDAMKARFEMDLEYIRNYSLRMDLKIVWLTFKSMVLGRTNAH
jgi:putative colanic acid biosynthesis UDP-glucose lipid carrier transferase